MRDVKAGLLPSDIRSKAAFRICWRETCMTAWVLDLAVVAIGFWPGMHSCVAQET